MIKNIITLSALFFVFASPIAQASKNIKLCEETSATNIELSQCLDGVKSAVDRELQTWVNNQNFILEEIELSTGRGSALMMFKRSQSNFITFRENNCRWQYLALSPGTGAGSAYKKCYINVSLTRIKELTQLNE